MLDPNKVKLAIAPIGWTNDDMPDLGGENTFEQCVSEMALAGFKGSEIGNKYPQDVNVLKHKLDVRGLQICNAWFSTLFTSEPYEVTIKNFIAHRDRLHALGAKVIRMNAEIEAKEKHVQELEEAVKTMKANERTRRIEAAKAAVNAKFKDMNAVREECFDNELAEKVCQMCNEGKFCEDEDDQGQWCGDKKAVNALMALCMEAQAEMDKQAAAKKTHVFNAWSEAQGDQGDHGVDSVDKMLAFLGE